MDMQDVILLLVGIGLGYYVYSHYAKTGRAM